MDSNDRDPLDEALIALREAIERNIDRASRTAAQLDRTLISLSAGALLLSSTFVPIFAPQKLWLFLLFAAWLSFLATMIFVILAMHAEQSYAETAIKRASVCLRQLERQSNSGAGSNEGNGITSTNQPKGSYTKHRSRTFE